MSEDPKAIRAAAELLIARTVHRSEEATQMLLDQITDLEEMSHVLGAVLVLADQFLPGGPEIREKAFGRVLRQYLPDSLEDM